MAADALRVKDPRGDADVQFQLQRVGAALVASVHFHASATGTWEAAVAATPLSMPGTPFGPASMSLHGAGVRVPSGPDGSR